MDKDPVYAEGEKVLALKNILHFFELHAWTHEPRPEMLRLYGVPNPLLPFLLYDYQKETVLKIQKCIREGRDLLAEKSRDMGVTWMYLAVFLWFWLQPVAGNDFLLGSRKWDYVDRKGSQDTLFEKFRYLLYQMHTTFLPEGFEQHEHDNVGFLANPETGSYLRGESNNANFGTSGRYRAALMDEFSKWEETDAHAWTSMGDSTPCRLPVSTPWGLGRKFAQLRHSGAIDVITLKWTLHPIKGAGHYIDEQGKDRSPWYDAECERRRDDPEANVGQELDIDYLSSGSPYFDNTLMSNRYKELSGMDLLNQPDVQRYEIEQDGAKNIKLVPKDYGRLIILKEVPAINIYSMYRYCVSCDTAEGLEKGDFDSVYVFDRVEGEDVAWFHGKCDTDVLALILIQLAQMYDDAFIGVENNNHGHAVVQSLKSFDANQMYEQDFTEDVDLTKMKLGWNTNKATRPIMCAGLREAVKQGVDGIWDKEFYNEAMTFILNKNGKPEAEQGCYDDRVMAQAIKFMLHEWLPAPRKQKPIREADHGYYDHGELRETLKKDYKKKGARFV